MLVDTIAGNGTAGTANGTGSAASFNYSYGLAKDSAGNMYVADRLNHVVRKISQAGVVTTFAGTMGVGGTVNGPKATATFNSPTAIAADAAGNVYVFDSVGTNLRKIDTAGNVTTLVPFSVWLTTGYTGGFNVLGMAADANGNVFLSDWACSCIRKVSSSGTPSVYAGTYGSAGHADGPAAIAKFSFAQGLALDAAGNLYVADTSNRRVRKVTPGGIVSTLAGDGIAGHLDGPGSTARFYSMGGIAVAANGKIYVNDFSASNSYLREISPAGVVTTLAGGAAGFVDGPLATAKFSAITGMTTIGARIYLTDSYNQRIRRIMYHRITTSDDVGQKDPPPPN